MKIGHHTESASALSSVAAQKQPPRLGAVREESRPAVGGAAVTLSRSVRNAEGARAVTEFDVDKVAAMKAAIANGTFKVNAGAIADKLLANAFETLSHYRD